jgi:ABC-type transporter Mla subunit MlaD
MRRLALIAAIIAGAGAGFAATAVGEDSNTYFIELDNAFGLVEGSEVKVAGVTQGTITKLYINADKRAVLQVELAGPLSKLGTDTVCSSEPQSLIAEYFIDCIPKGDPLDEQEGTDAERVENPDIPVEQTRQTVQPDLVQSALRAPFKDRLTLIINEFGTALAGNPENLNSAIRRGAPALTTARKVTNILADQNTIIRDLNADSDTIIAKLNERSGDVVRFIKNARQTADASAAVRDDLSANFEKLDDFLAELKPTMVELNNLAVAQTPVLADLRAAGPGLDTLSSNLPGFNSAATTSVKSLADAAVVGERALRKGNGEIKQLAKSSKKAFAVSDSLSKFLRDLDDPRRAIEIDARVEGVTGRDSSKPGTKNTMGYTGLEGLLNYVYYQAGAISQYDAVSHLLHFSIFEAAEGACSDYNAGGGDPGDPLTVPDVNGDPTTDATQVNRCVAWLGKNQPGINEDLGIPPYDPSVCPDGSLDENICDPDGARRKSTELGDSASSAPDVRDPSTDGDGDVPDLGDLGGGGDSGSGDSGAGSSPADDVRDALPGVGDILDGLPGVGKNGLDLKQQLRANGSAGGSAASSTEAAGDLLNFLLAD